MARATAKRRASKATKLPSRRVRSDDYAVDLGGKEYRPHAGEWVDFRGRSTVESLIIDLRLQALLRLSGLTKEEAEETSALYERVTEDLARSIVAWSWTDDDWKELPSPPSPEVIRSLSVDELFWLLRGRFGGRTEEDRKNGSPPST